MVGAGPAGISAAMNVANRKRTVALFDSAGPLANARRAPSIPNYPGFTFTSGEELARAFLEHLERFEVPVFRERVTRILSGDGELYLSTDSDTYTARAVILATGVAREAEIEGEDELVGRGVSYCVNCDGRLFAGREVAVVGYLSEAEEEAAALADEIGAQVTYLPLYDGPYNVPDGVTVLAGHRPDRLCREDGRVRVVLPDRELTVDGVFIYRRSVSPIRLLDGLKLEGRHIAVDRRGYTGIPGVFAAGDCTGEPYQIAKAVGEGQVAALQAIRHVRSLENRTKAEAESVPAAASAAGSGVVGAPEDAGSASSRAEPALKDEDRRRLSEILTKLDSPVRLVHFTQLGDGAMALPCDQCEEARRLLTEFAELSPKLNLELHDFLDDHELAEELGVERIPATMVGPEAEERPRVRLFGVPAGYEFGPFLDDVLEISNGEVKLSDDTRARLAALEAPVHLEVLTTPTCPSCPAVVRLAHRFALASSLITADMVIASEFPELAHKYEVTAVPKLIVNGRPAPAGTLSEERLLELVLEAAGG
ncbi:MAG: hypothetical protein Kow00129_12540 [Thermoleophilia bacterium]